MSQDKLVFKTIKIILGQTWILVFFSYKNYKYVYNYDSPGLAQRCASAHRALPGIPDGQSSPALMSCILYEVVVVVVVVFYVYQTH